MKKILLFLLITASSVMAQMPDSLYARVIEDKGLDIMPILQMVAMIMTVLIFVLSMKKQTEIARANIKANQKMMILKEIMKINNQYEDFRKDLINILNEIKSQSDNPNIAMDYILKDKLCNIIKRLPQINLGYTNYLREISDLHHITYAIMQLEENIAKCCVKYEEVFLNTSNYLPPLKTESGDITSSIGNMVAYEHSNISQLLKDTNYEKIIDKCKKYKYDVVKSWKNVGEYKQ